LPCLDFAWPEKREKREGWGCWRLELDPPREDASGLGEERERLPLLQSRRGSRGEPCSSHVWPPVWSFG
jgi:hypothetical protein